MIKICEYCGEEYKPKSNNQKFCCDECKINSRSKPKIPDKAICKYCGNEFKPKRHNQIFCNNKCGVSYHNNMIRLNKIKYCVVCGKQLRAGRSKYCSYECMKINYKTPRNDVFGACSYCGNKYKKSNSNQQYCSDECRKLEHATEERERRLNKKSMKQLEKIRKPKNKNKVIPNFTLHEATKFQAEYDKEFIEKLHKKIRYHDACDMLEKGLKAIKYDENTEFSYKIKLIIEKIKAGEIK